MATEILKRHGYNLRRALDYYYDNRHRYPQAKNKKKGDKKKLGAVFDKFAGARLWSSCACGLLT